MSSPEGLPALSQECLSLVSRFENSPPAGSDFTAIAECMADAQDEHRPILFQHLLHVQLKRRQRQGESPSADEYLQHFPQFAEQIERVFAFSRAITTIQEPSSRQHQINGSACLPPVSGYEVLGVLGKGGMGIVYQARHLTLKRMVALKMMLAGPHAREHERMRFKTEAEAMARLQHHHILQIFEVGEYEGLPFCALEFVPGGSLAEKLRGQPLPPREAARLVATLAEAMQLAHNCNVVHRDLKPANVLLAGSLDTPIEKCLPKVTDFGLACQIDSDSAQTQAGAILGTPSYMAPEQASGKTQAIGPAADLYALGAILYECLTGRPPFRAHSPQETIRQVLENDPTPIRQLQPVVPRDLETIALKCLLKEPDKRYLSAQDLAEDLQRYLDGEPIRARPVSRLERGVKWMRRNPGRAVALLCAFLITASVLGMWLQSVQEQVLLTQAVNGDIDEAKTFYEKALRAPVGDLQSWGEAMAAVERAQGRLGDNGGDSDLRERVQSLLRDVAHGKQDAERKAALARQAAKEKEQDQRMLQLLEEAAALRQTSFVTDIQTADLATRQAFKDYGIEVENLSAADAAQAIAKRAIVFELVGALDALILYRSLTTIGSQLGDPKQFLEIARRVDSDDCRNQLRTAFVQKNKQFLSRLAREIKVKEVSPSTIFGLGHALLAVNEIDGAIDLFRRGVQIYPDNYGLNVELASWLIEMQPPQADDSLRFAQAAVTMRPDRFLPHLLVGDALRVKGNLSEAILYYKESIRLKNDFPIAHFNLGQAFHIKGELEQSIACYKEAIRLKNDYADAFNNLGLVFRKKGDLQEAVAHLKEAIRLKNDFAEAHSNLGAVLRDKGDFQGAVERFKLAIQLKKDLPVAHANLANALHDKGDVDGAIASYHAALRVDKHNSENYYNLAVAYSIKGNLDAAIIGYKEAIRLKKDSPSAHFNLGICLRRKGELDAAILSYKESIRLKNDDPNVHCSLGNVLNQKGDTASAIASYQEAIRLKKNFPEAYHYLGKCLMRTKDLGGAIDCFKEAIRIKNQDYPEAQIGLGIALQEQGRFAEGLHWVRSGHQLGSKNPKWKLPSATWVKQGERMVELDQRLPAVLEGEDIPATNTERLEFAVVCLYKQLFAASSQLYAEAFKEDVALTNALGDRHRQSAAYAAAQAGAGKGVGVPDTEMQRSKLRHQALEWLKSDLQLWSKALGNKEAKIQAAARQQLQGWQTEPALAGVRDPASLANLPPMEQRAWSDFWLDVAGVVKR